MRVKVKAFEAEDDAPADEMDDNGEIPDVHFGEVSDKPFDWRKEGPAEDDDDDDEDDESAETPPEVVAMLGFDPKDDEDDSDVEESTRPGSSRVLQEEPLGANATRRPPRSLEDLLRIYIQDLKTTGRVLGQASKDVDAIVAKLSLALKNPQKVDPVMQGHEYFSQKFDGDLGSLHTLIDQLSEHAERVLDDMKRWIKR